MRLCPPITLVFSQDWLSDLIDSVNALMGNDPNTKHSLTKLFEGARTRCILSIYRSSLIDFLRYFLVNSGFGSG